MLVRQDRQRRRRGAILERIGYGPQRTPGRLVHRTRHVRLRAFDGVDGPALILVPAPIKQPWLFDLAPGTSVVRAAMAAGLRPFLVEWPDPEDERPGLA